MKLEIKASPIIDTLMDNMESIEVFHRNVPKGAYIREGSEYRNYWNNSNKAAQGMSAASDILGISEQALCRAVLAARRWYTRTEWQICLPEDDAARLLACMIEQYPRSRWPY